MQYTSASLLTAAALFLSRSVQGLAIRADDSKPCPTWGKNATVGMPVNTTSGTLVGHASKDYPAVSEYLGVPFAKPPVDDLRFAPPQAYKSNGSTITAAKQPRSCVQDTTPYKYNSSDSAQWNNIQASDASFKTDVSEDCLYLNVWTKFPYPGAPLKPVMVWFYGGGFHSGGASDKDEQGGIFADEEDVVAVNFNYRLNVFGFAGAPGIPDNVGLLDQRLAVEWVRDNIAAFGGDPNRIIIYGHSAGSTSVDLYNFAWLEDPIISGSIIMSGTANSGHRTPETAHLAWSTVSSMVGCGNASTTPSDKVMSCMRSKPAEAIYNASAKANSLIVAQLPPDAAAQTLIEGTYGPTIDNKTVFANYSALGQAGKFVRKPILTGNNNDEGCFFLEAGRAPAAEVPLITAAWFTCPTNRISYYRAAAGVPTWKYRYFGAYPNLYANACPGEPWHGQEIYVLFGSSETASNFSAVPQEVDVGWYMRNAWATFARHPEVGLTNVMGWPTYHGNDSNVIALGMNNTEMSYIDGSSYDQVCFTEFTQSQPNY